MSKTMRISGVLQTNRKNAFRTLKLQVEAIVGERIVASCPVDQKGNFRLKFRQESLPRSTRLRVVPATAQKLPVEANFLSDQVGANRFKKTARDFQAVSNLYLPDKYFDLILRMKKRYSLQGVVYVQYPTWLTTLPGVRLDFYEVDRPWILFWPPLEEAETSESFLGSAYTGPDGGYEFSFSFSYTNLLFWIFQDRIPDVRVRASQFIDGVWQNIYEGEVDWDIEEEFHRDYLIPWEDVFGVAPNGVKPEEGFRFISLGLIPIDEAGDTAHFSGGYVSCYPGDPLQVSSVRHQPLCGTLRIFGLFAAVPPVLRYLVEIAPVNTSGTKGNWESVTDPLHNRKWNPAIPGYEHQVLGPAPNTGMYQNIDSEPEADWHEHGLKVTWNSRNYPDGFYCMRITGYGAGDSPVVTQEMPLIRVDNSRPETRLQTTVAIGVCGNTTLDLSDRKIDFLITAHDPDGHVKSFFLSGTRGNLPGKLSAGDTLQQGRGGSSLLWNGVEDETFQFTVKERPAELSGCPTLAYNFELHSYGLSTDGYSATPNMMKTKKEVNLVVTE